MKIENIKQNTLIYFTIITFMSIGPVFYSLGIKLTVLMVLVYLIHFTFNLIRSGTTYHIFYFLLVLHFATTFISCVQNNTFIPLIFTSLFILSFFLALQLDGFAIIEIVKKLSDIFFVMVVFAWLSYFYYVFGGNPLFNLANPNGVPNGFYIFSFSIGFPFRPTGIYDEPGAFSFFICLLVYLRTQLKMNFYLSAFLMVGGLITLSLGHIIFFIVWVFGLTIASQEYRLSIFKRILIPIIFIIFCTLVLKYDLMSWVFERVDFWVENPQTFVRLVNFGNVYEGVSDTINHLLFGFNNENITRADVENLGENILTPLVYGGIAVSWPFFAFVVFCLIYPFIIFRNFSLVGIGLLLFQRPYFLESPYSYCLSIIVTLLILPNSEYIKNNNVK